MLVGCTPWESRTEKDLIKKKDSNANLGEANKDEIKSYLSSSSFKKITLLIANKIITL